MHSYNKDQKYINNAALLELGLVPNNKNYPSILDTDIRELVDIHLQNIEFLLEQSLKLCDKDMKNITKWMEYQTTFVLKDAEQIENYKKWCKTKLDEYNKKKLEIEEIKSQFAESKEKETNEKETMKNKNKLILFGFDKNHKPIIKYVDEIKELNKPVEKKKIIVNTI